MVKTELSFDNLGKKSFTKEAVIETRKMMKKFKSGSHWGLAYNGRAAIPITHKMAKELTLLGLEEYILCLK